MRKLSVKKIESLWKAYLQKQRALYIAQKCAVNRRTAIKYIERGDPKRGIEAFKKRFAKIQKATEKKENYDLVKANAQNLKLVRAYKAKLTDKIKRLDPNDLPAALSKEIDNVAKLESFLLGGPSEREEQTYEMIIKHIEESEGNAA